MKNQKSGTVSILVVIVVFLLLKKFGPALLGLIRLSLILFIVLVVAAVVLIIFFAVRGTQKTERAGSRKTASDGDGEQTDNANAGDTAAENSAAEDTGAEALPPLDDSQREILAGAREVLKALRRHTVRIRHTEIRGVCEQICERAEMILRALRKKPQAIPKLRQFLNYYLPTIEKILAKYVRLEESGTPGDDITESTRLHLEDIRLALENQHKAIFADDRLDLSVEMEALRLACLRDGLLTEEDFAAIPRETEKQNLTL